MSSSTRPWKVRPQVPVGGVEDPHADTVSQPTDINDDGLLRSVGQSPTSSVPSLMSHRSTRMAWTQVLAAR